MKQRSGHPENVLSLLAHTDAFVHICPEMTLMAENDAFVAFLSYVHRRYRLGIPSVHRPFTVVPTVKRRPADVLATVNRRTVDGKATVKNIKPFGVQGRGFCRTQIVLYPI